MPLILTQAEHFAIVYRERLQPWMTRDLDVYAGAVAQMFEQVYDLVRDQGTDGDPDYLAGWGSLLDPDFCPAWALPYLGQFVGIGNLIGVAESVARVKIKTQPRARRGTPQAIVDAAAGTLTGSQTVVLVERYQDDPYQILVITYTAETADQAATLAAIESVKPAGIILTYVVRDGQDWDQVRDEAGGHVWSQVQAEYADWDDVRDNIP